MLDQTFSPKNFRRIYDLENRRGRNLSEMFFPEVHSKIEEIRDCVRKSRNLRKRKDGLSDQEYEGQKDALEQIEKNLKFEKENLLDRSLREISQLTSNGDHRVKLRKVEMPGKKPAYKIDESAASFFAIKQVQRNLNRLYKVKQSDRNEIVCQVRDILNDKMPKKVLRTDFKNFYESIPRTRLISRIEEDHLLAPTSKKIIRQVLSEYTKLIEGGDCGIPRGVGISAYLAELFAREFDETIKRTPNLLYYARYVDDILMVFSPHPDTENISYKVLAEEAAAKLKLSLNEEKTAEVDLPTQGLQSFDYLGYRFEVQDGKVELRLSEKKVRKYEERIRLCLASYARAAKLNEKKARKSLLRRMWFLAGNTRLHNSKRNAYVGIFFSNKFLTNKVDLLRLDAFLQREFGELSLPNAKNRIGKVSFEKAFTEIRYSRFSASELKEIVGVWKNAT